MSKRVPLLIILIVTLVASAARAQTTSSLSGTITSDGAPLPGATITISSPALQGTRTAVSGENGGYSFAALPPGVYTVRVELQGLQTIAQTITLTLAQPGRVDADLKVSAITEAITVTAAMPATLETSEISTNISAELLDRLPTNRNVLSAVSLAPAVAPGIGGRPDNPNLGFSIAGAASSDSVYLINGVVVNENLRGQPHNLFIEDAIQETTVLTGGISAEYGRFTGGVVNTITKSGGNNFSGSLRDTLTNPQWTLRTPNQTVQNRDALSHTYEGTLGGFLLRDRLWFFAAGRMQNISESFFTTLTNIPFTRTRDQQRMEGKLTAQVTPKHSLVGSYLDVTDDLQNDFQFNPMDERSLFNRSTPNSLYSIHYNGVLTNSFLLEGLYSNKEFIFKNSGSPFTDRIGGTLLVDASNTNRRYWAPTFCGVCGDEERNNSLMQLKGNYFLSSQNLGSHNIVVGGESFAEQRLANNFQSGSNFRIFHTVLRNGAELRPRFDSTTVIQWNPIFSASSGTDLQTRSVFINDRWDLNQRLSFNVGVRYDQNKAQDADGNPVSDDSAFSPRLGVQFDVAGDGRHKISASYSRYVNDIAEGNVAGAGQAGGNPSTVQWTYRGPVINGDASTPFNQLLGTEDALRQLFAWFDSVGGTNNREPGVLLASAIAGVATRIPDSLTSPSVDEIALGYGVQIGRNAYVRTDLVARDWANFYATRLTTDTGRVTDPFGNVGDLALVENTNDVEREYRAAIISGQWQRSALSIGGNYTWSTLKGNDETEAVATATSPTIPLAIYYPEFLGYENRLPKGYLAEDVRHRMRAWVGYNFRLGPAGELSLSLLQSYFSGTAYSAIGQIDATGRTAGTSYTGVPTVPAYTLSQIGSRHNYYFTKRGELRTDAFNSTDIAATYSLPISRVELFVQANVLNVLNRQSVIVPNATVLTRRTSSTAGLKAFNPFTETPIECPQGAAASQCTALGAHWQKGPQFGTPADANGYQLPRTYRASVGFRF